MKGFAHDDDNDDPSLRPFDQLRAGEAQGKLDSGQARLPAWRRGDEVIRRRGIAIDYSLYGLWCRVHGDGVEGLEKKASYEKHLNKYYTIHLDITSFITGASAKETIVDEMVELVVEELKWEA